MDQIVVIKCGGSTVDALPSAFFESIAAMKECGKHPVVVHGGGPAINDMLKQLDIESEFVNGLRKTTDEVLEAAEMVLSGKVNKNLVAAFQKAGTQAVGMSGVDGELLKASPVDLETLGLVGKVEEVNETIIEFFIKNDVIPVIAPIASAGDGEKLNVNADEAAAAVARALEAEELVFVTDVDGVLINGKITEKLDVDEIDTLIKNKTIYGGMIPKVKAAAASLTGNIEKVTIANGNGKNTYANGSLKGTAIMKQKETIT
ncbi:acetylglutamate kinase [Alteribacillus iranensis]|uniref:Acetylglutamate kinase n=1 Tax=Alteribacillus iranensis TaxID=930128 RepID=A0A1I2CXC5_9BACI|nr:acetylglutamate kinase [Alteribacillus iranensis]SFE72936.1 N-acetylglutamate kinase [Alteribacillus iranensis]